MSLGPLLCSRQTFVLVFAYLMVGAAWADVSRPVREKTVMGWLESVYLRPWNLRVTAKLDTGANTSSLHSDDVDHFNKGSEEWVRFKLEDREGGKSIVVERPVVRTAYIKERNARSSKRHVVTLTICKNGKEYETEFTLGDRSNFNYPLLLGRSFLKDVALVDADATFLFKADDDPCKSKVPLPSDGGGAK